MITKDNQTIKALANITGVDSRIDYILDGQIVPEGTEGAKPSGVLVLETSDGTVEIELDDFDAIYKGWVKCWPVVKPTKDAVTAELRVFNAADRLAKAAAAKAAKEQEGKAAKEAKAAELAKAKAEKEATAAAKKADQDAKLAERRKTMEEGAAAAKAKLAREREAAQAKANEAKQKMEQAKPVTPPATPAKAPAKKK